MIMLPSLALTGAGPCSCASDPDIRILRRVHTLRDFPLAPHEGGPVRRIGILDLETTGTDPARDEIIDLAFVVVEVDEAGEIVGIASCGRALRDPGCSIPELIQKLTGISDDDVRDQVIDLDRLERRIKSVDLVVAHNARFDCAFLRDLMPGLSNIAIACSLHDIDWLAAGREGGRLSHLLMQKGKNAMNNNEKTLLRQQNWAWALRETMGLPLYFATNESLIFSAAPSMDATVALEQGQLAMRIERDIIHAVWAEDAESPHRLVVVMRNDSTIDVIDNWEPYSSAPDAPITLVASGSDAAFRVGPRSMLIRETLSVPVPDLARGKRLASARLQAAAVGMGNEIAANTRPAAAEGEDGVDPAACSSPSIDPAPPATGPRPQRIKS